MSNSFNAVGRLGRDSEQRFLQDGSAVLSFPAAVDTGFGDRKATMWVRVSLFGKRAEGQLGQYLKKGTQVFISGEIHQSEYQAQDGTTKTTLEMANPSLQLIGGHSGNDGGQQQAPQQQAPQQRPQQQAPQQRPQQQAPQQRTQQAQPQAAAVYDNFDEDIPF